MNIGKSSIAQGLTDVNLNARFHDVTVGQKLNPLPLWNRTERGENCLTVPTEIIGKKHATSQTGIMFKVLTKGGSVQWLDAGWFELPN